MAAQREWFEKDYYQVLGVSENASQKEITRAYRKLAKQHHPDANPGSEDRFKEISTAYDVLGDEKTRKEYDEVRRLGPMAGGFGGAGPGAGGGFGGSFRVDDLGDLFGGLFNRGTRQNGGPQRGADLETEMHLSFDEAINGTTKTVYLTSDAACSRCSGTGAEPGTSPQICPTCGGRGALDENQGLFSFSQPCPSCGGNGMVIENPCSSCHGTGIERRPRQVNIRIPPGVNNEQHIRIKGKGGAGRNGGPSGDLFVRTYVGEHSLFKRRGNDLLINVPVTFPEASLGTTLKVPTLSGSVTLKIPPGTPSGKVFRVKGKGITKGRKTGDLLVKTEVAVPQKLSKEEKEAVERLASASKESPRSHLGGS